MIKSFASTHIGQRKLNEDSYCLNEKKGLFIVADGVGGLSKGEVASQLACEIIEKEIGLGDSLQQAISKAHQAILDKINESDENHGMATTVVAVRFDGNFYEVAWVGDSRVYLWDGHLKLLTRDHSFVEMLLDNGHINVEQLDTHPDKNIISQALGIVRKDIKVSFNSGTLEKNQILLICSDGLSGVVSELEMIKKLNQEKDLEKTTNFLVSQAVENDGKDNITLIAVQSDEDSFSKSEVILANVVRCYDNVDGSVVIEVEQKSGYQENHENIITKSVVPTEVNKTPSLFHLSKKSYNQIVVFLSLILVMMILVILIKL